MRTVHDVRSRLLETLLHVVRRPEMYGGNEDGVELIMEHLLDELCYIDQREDELRRARDDLQARRVFRAAGVSGTFRWRFGRAGRFPNEVASIYAEIAHRLGYLAIDRTLAPAEWQQLRTGLRRKCRGRDWRASEIAATFGLPSLKFGSTVYAYVPEGVAPGWLFFDFDRTSRPWPDQDYLLRNVRLPAQDFARGVTLTPYGRQLRGGS